MDKYLIKPTSSTGTNSSASSRNEVQCSKTSKPPLSKTTSVKTLKTLKEVKDIAALGEPIVRCYLKNYPKSDGRSFNSDWFREYEWIEYSPSLDAIFCYACRQFNFNATKEQAFTVNGYRNWKNARCKNKGISQHASSDAHLAAMKMWVERQERDARECTISTLLNDNVLERRRYYIKSIAEVIQFLAVNELPLRRTYSLEEGEEHGIFRNFFSFVMKKDEKLSEAFKIMPKNANYMSPHIQNEVIHIMAKMIKEEIINDVKSADVPWFTLLEDGTKDKNRRENIAIALRYVKNGQAHEALLCIKTSDKFDVKTFTDLTIKELEESGLSIKNILSQCYDGAAVMSGRENGVQALIQKRAERKIPYIHCANHRLHLVIIKTIANEDIIQQFFDQCSNLYCFFSQAKVHSLYHGRKIVRLLPQRWCGHLKVTQVIFENYKEILDVLEDIIKRPSDFNGEDVVQSEGLLQVLKKNNFKFLLVFIKEILETLEPADQALQSRQVGLTECASVIDATIESIQRKRSDEHFQKITNAAENLFKNETNGKVDEQATVSKRKRKESVLLKEFVVTEKTGRSSESESTRRIYYAIIDVVLTEINIRFKENKELMDALVSAEQLLDDNTHNRLKSLEELGITIPSSEEFTVVRNYLSKFENPDIFNEVYKQRVAFENTYSLLVSVKFLGAVLQFVNPHFQCLLISIVFEDVQCVMNVKLI